MKTKLLIPAVLAITLPLSTLSAMAAADTNSLGQSMPTATADETIRIGPETKYVNVQGGQIVRFDVGDKSFIWKFNGFDDFNSFDLNRIAPPGLLDHTVKTYVSPNPIYMGR